MIQAVFIWGSLASPLAALALLTNSLPVAAVASLALPFLGLVLFAMRWWLLRAPGGTTARSEWTELDPNEAAFLGGSDRLAVDAAITSLVQRRVLAVDVLSEGGKLADAQASIASLEASPRAHTRTGVLAWRSRM